TKLQMLCQRLAKEQSAQGRKVIIRIEGWETLERRIGRYPEAINAFDPSYAPWGRGIKQSLDTLQETSRAGFANMEVIATFVASLQTSDATTSAASAVERELDAAIDDYRDRLLRGQPRTALALFESLFRRLKPETSDRIRF